MEAITAFLEDFDFAKILPEIGKFMFGLRFWMNFIMLLGPVILLVFGLWYYFRPVTAPHAKLGFRVRLAMASQEAWAYSQKMAGWIWMYLGGAMTIVSVVLIAIFLALEPLTMALGAVIWLGVQALLTVVSYVYLQYKIIGRYGKNGAK